MKRHRTLYFLPWLIAATLFGLLVVAASLTGKGGYGGSDGGSGAGEGMAPCYTCDDIMGAGEG